MERAPEAACRRRLRYQGAQRQSAMKSPRLRFHLVAAAVLSLAVAAGPALVGDEAFDHTTRLTALAKVWGLLKYFHPQVAQGSLDWDTALLDAIPHVKAADTKAAFNEEIMRLIDMAGPPRVPATAPLEAPEADPAFGWLDDQQVFAPETIAALKAIRHGEVPSSNRYVRPVPSVGNPDFSGEAPYDDPPYPREEMRLLALFRFWNMFQFYAPNRDVLDRNWADVLPALIPRFIEAANPSAYHLAVCELTASINDTHAFTGSSTLTLYLGYPRAGDPHAVHRIADRGHESSRAVRRRRRRPPRRRRHRHRRRRDG